MSTRVGRGGEDFVERWLSQQGWACAGRNLRITGGEIDRLFVRDDEQRSPYIDICVAEVKTSRVRSLRQFGELFSEAKMRTLVRPHQLRNLWRMAAQYESHLQRRHRSKHVRTYVRYFLVVAVPQGLVAQLRADLRKGSGEMPVRLCSIHEGQMILAWSPDTPGGL